MQNLETERARRLAINVILPALAMSSQAWKLNGGKFRHMTRTRGPLLKSVPGGEVVGTHVDGRNIVRGCYGCSDACFFGTPAESAPTMYVRPPDSDGHFLATGFETVEAVELDFTGCDASYHERAHMEPTGTTKATREHARALGHGRQLRPTKLGTKRSKDVSSVEATDVFFGDRELDMTLCWLLDEWERAYSDVCGFTRKDLGNAIALLYLETPNPYPERHREKTWLRRLFKTHQRKITFAADSPFATTEHEEKRQRLNVQARQRFEGLTPDEVDALEQVAAWAERDPETAEKLIEEWDREHVRRLDREWRRRDRHPERYKS